VNLRNCPQEVLNKGTFWSHLHSSQTLEMTWAWILKFWNPICNSNTIEGGRMAFLRVKRSV
jgi:hypothetical protein